MKIITNFLAEKHDNYVLEMIAKLLILVFGAGILLAMFGVFTKSVWPSVVGLLLMALPTGWDRLMSYLTWREDDDTNY